MKIAGCVDRGGALPYLSVTAAARGGGRRVSGSRHASGAIQETVRHGQRAHRQGSCRADRRHQRPRRIAGGAERRRAPRQDFGIQGADRRGRDHRRPAGRSLRHHAGGRQAHARPAPLRRAARRRHRPPSGKDRGDGDRRGQDPGRDAAGLSQRARRQGRARHHGERLSGPARRRLDGRDLPVPGPRRRLHRARARRCGAPRAVPRRRHLRHQQRVRLRLSARQHEVHAGNHGPAPLQLLHRRRGRQHPDRRGAHAADHLGPVRGQLGHVPEGRPRDPRARAGRFRDRREGPRSHAHRRRRGARRGAAQPGTSS